jgi:hypothetical protein
MKRIFLTGFLLLIFQVVVSAASLPEINEQKEEWIRIDKGKQSVYIDKKSIRRSTRIAGKIIYRVWGKFVYDEPKPSKSKYIGISLRYYEWFCNDRMFRILQEINHYTDGSSEVREDLEIRDWQRLYPDMSENSIYKNICR